MLIKLRSHGFVLTDALEDRCKSRIESSLRFAAERITGVVVQLDDINGQRHGGEDKTCRIAIRLRAMQAIIVEATHHDLYVAIDWAAAKAKAALSKKLARRLKKHQRPEPAVNRWHARLAFQ